MADEADFDAFVVARSPALLRTAYLLVQDEGLAEDLLQTALTKAWFAWRRIEEPEAYVRRIMVTTSASWWRRRWTRETPTADAAGAAAAPDGAADAQDLWDAIGACRGGSARWWCCGTSRTAPRWRPPSCWAARWARSRASARRRRQAPGRRCSGAGHRREEPVMNTEDLRCWPTAPTPSGRQATASTRCTAGSAARRRGSPGAAGAAAWWSRWWPGAGPPTGPTVGTQEPVDSPPGPSPDRDCRHPRRPGHVQPDIGPATSGAGRRSAPAPTRQPGYGELPSCR